MRQKVIVMELRDTAHMNLQLAQMGDDSRGTRRSALRSPHDTGCRSLGHQAIAGRAQF